MDNNEIEFEDSVTLLCITVDNRLSFHDHISKLYNEAFMLKKKKKKKKKKKAFMQLNAIFRLKKCMSQKFK